MDNSNLKKDNEKKERRFSQEQYEMLKRCSKRMDMSEWNQWRKENFDSEICLEGAELSHIYLIGADLSRAYLTGASLNVTFLDRADLHGANLSEAFLNGANLNDADLHNADLNGICAVHILLIGANIKGADLSNSILGHADLTEADLSEADLTGAKLEGARLIRTNLSNATVENTVIKDMQIHELTGLPKPPTVLRLEIRGGAMLTGHEAESFFKLPAIVEVYLTDKLSQRELACFNLHMAEMQDRQIGIEIHLIGHRYEGKGSVLRFQAPSYDDIYKVMPDLLAPFRMAQAVDWKQSIEAIPEDERGDAITALAMFETSTYEGKWRFAERMASFFETYARARVYQISEERRLGIRIDVYTDEEVAERLSRIALPADLDSKEPLIIRTGDNANIQIASGDGASVQARDISLYKQTIERSDNLDAKLKEKIKEARETIEKLKLSKADKDDVADELGKLTSELEKTRPDPDRARRLWNHIKEVAPTVASILQTAESLAKLLFS